MRSPIAAGRANPSPPIAGLKAPSGSRAGRRTMQLWPAGRGLLDHDGVARQALGERGEDVPGSERLARRRRRRRRGRHERRGRRSVARRHDPRELGAHGRGMREHRDVRRASVHLGRILADHGDPRPGLDERPGMVGVLPEHRRADGEHDVVRRECLPQARAVGGQVAGEEGVILGEPGSAAEGLLPDRAYETLGQRDERVPGVAVVGAGPDDESRALGRGYQVGELRDASRCPPFEPARHGVVRRARPPEPPRLASRPSARSPGRDHARGHGLVTSAGDRAGNVLRADGLVDPHGVVACEPLQLSREKRLRCEVAPVLLADEHDEWSTVDAGSGEGADRVSEAGGRVQDRERGLATPDRPAGGHADHRALVEPEHEAKVVRQVGEQIDLRRPGIREERR